MKKIVSDTDLKVNYFGTVIVLKAGSARDLHDAHAAVAIEAGARLAEAEVVTTPSVEESEPDKEEIIVTDEVLRNAIHKLMEEGDETNFNQTGLPKKVAVRRIIGASPENDHLEKIWTEVQGEILAKNDAEVAESAYGESEG